MGSTTPNKPLIHRLMDEIGASVTRKDTEAVNSCRERLIMIAKPSVATETGAAVMKVFELSGRWARGKVKCSPREVREAVERAILLLNSD